MRSGLHEPKILPIIFWGIDRTGKRREHQRHGSLRGSARGPAHRYRGLMEHRTLIISDTHLGRPFCSARSAAALQPLWADFDRLIVNGDVAEIHHPQYGEEARRQVRELRDRCASQNVDLTLVSGNHDSFLSDIAHLELADGHIFVTHGDALHPAIAPWSSASRRIRAAHEKASRELQAMIDDELLVRLGATQLASFAEWQRRHERFLKIPTPLYRPWVFLQVLHYWSRVPALASAFANRFAPGASFILLGHTHRAGITQRGERTIINTGCFGPPSAPRAVALEGDSLNVFRILAHGRTFRLASKPLATFPLPEPVVAPAPAEEPSKVAA